MARAMICFRGKENVKCVHLNSEYGGIARCEFAFNRECLQENCLHYELHNFNQEICEASNCSDRLKPEPEPFWRRISL